MRNIIFKSKILKDILGQDNITKLEDLDKLFHESESFEGLYESTVDLKDIEFSEQDMNDLIDDINLLNNLDKDNIRCIRLVNFTEELKQRKIIYSVLNPTLVEIEDEEEYKKQLSRKNDDLKISKELRKHILPEFLQCDISTSDLIEYIRKFMPYIKPEDSERDEAHNLIGPLLENECVCEGYALALKQALKCSGLEAQCIVGNVDRDEFDIINKLKIVSSRK